MTGLYVASNSNSLTAQFHLTRNMGQLADTLTRLSTGLRINSGKDDPAGLIASELLKADITGTAKAISNTQRANSLIATADSALSQVGNLLNDIKGLVVESANTGAMSADQIKANQLQVDATIESIDRIARSTTYAGSKILDGSLDFSTSAKSGNAIDDLRIDQANFGNRDKIDVEVRVLETAKRGTLIYNGNGVDSRTTISVSGSVGTKSFTFGAGTSNATIAAMINAASDSTGVSARVEGMPSRGTVELNGVGSDNGIVVTANEQGHDAGNYTFRIVKGATSDAYVVSEPNSAKPGVIEISLAASYEANYENFAGLFDIALNTGSASSSTSVSITHGTVNRAFYADRATAASGVSTDGKTLTVTNAGNGGAMSELNGWTVEIVDAGDTQYDDEAKLVRTTAVDLETALSRITGADSGVAVASSVALEAGDRFTLGGGAAGGELVISYKEGATAGDLLKQINSVSGVQASLKQGVSSDSLVPLVLSAPTRAAKDASEESRYTSDVSAAELVGIINSKLGDRFTAALKTDSSGNLNGTGKMTYMNASASYGSVNLDNGLLFTGLDSGPVVRMVTTDANGSPVFNQQLGVRLVNPTEADLAAGRTTPILEIRLATDGQGNSITSAADIVELFNRLTPERTGGVSVSLTYPDGVDPNGRTWVSDECGNLSVVSDCNANYGRGIVPPTGTVGPCEIQTNDIVLLGDNQTLQEVGYPSARIPSSSSFDTHDAIASNHMTTTGDEGTVHLDFGATSALNGVSFTFTSDPGKAGFDATTGRLNVYLDPATKAKTGKDFTNAVMAALDGQIAHNWADIREFTGATGDPVTVNRITYSNEDGTAADYTKLLELVDSTADTAVLTLCGCSGGGIPAPATTTKTTVQYDNGGMLPTQVRFWLETDTNTDELNDVTIRFGATAGYDASSKTLTIANITTSQADAQAFSGVLAGLINDALNASSLTNPGVTVHYEEDGFTMSVDPSNLADLNFGTFVGGSTGSWTSESKGGIGAADAALVLTSVTPGPSMAGTRAVFVQDSSLDPGAIRVDYDEDRRLLTVIGNPADGIMSATDLADLLNADETYRKHFQEIDLQKDVTPGATVAFSASSAPPAYLFTGGYEIVTQSHAGGDSGGTGSSSGTAMFGGTDDNQRLVLEALEYGSEHFVQVVAAQGSQFDTSCPLGLKMNRLAGTDVVATINGIAATGRGTHIAINTSDLALSLDVTNRVGTSSFSITGGGALFQLGTNVVSSQQMRLGLPSMLSTDLGGTSGLLFQLKTGGKADLVTSDASRKLADRIVNESISFVATQRGRLGAVQKSSLEPNIAVLQDSMVALTEAQGLILNADFAEESSQLTRLQLLIQSGMQTLSIANQFPQYAAQLVR